MTRLFIPAPQPISRASRAADTAAARYLVRLRDRAPESLLLEARERWRELVRAAVLESGGDQRLWTSNQKGNYDYFKTIRQ